MNWNEYFLLTKEDKGWKSLEGKKAGRNLFVSF